MWVHLFPLLEHEIAAAPRRGHRVSRIASVIINAVELRRRRSSENRIFHAFLVLTFQVFFKQAVRRFERFVQSAIVEKWRGLATFRSDRIELLLLELLGRRRLRFAPELVLAAFAGDQRWISSRTQMIIVVGRLFLEIPTESRVIVNGRLALVRWRSLLRSRTQLILPHREARLVRRRAHRRYRRGIQIEIIRARFTPNHRRIDTRRARVGVLMLVINGRGERWTNVWQLGVWRWKGLGRLQFSASYGEARCEWLQGCFQMIKIQNYFRSSSCLKNWEWIAFHTAPRALHISEGAKHSYSLFDDQLKTKNQGKGKRNFSQSLNLVNFHTAKCRFGKANGINCTICYG